jgi:hypothetical protein
MHVKSATTSDEVLFAMARRISEALTAHLEKRVLHASGCLQEPSCFHRRWSMPRLPRSVSRKAFVFGIGLLAGIAGAQTQPAIPAKAATSPMSGGAYNWFGRTGLVCGAGASNSSVATKPTVQCGGLFSGPFFDFETGVMGPQANQSAVSGYLSTNLSIPLIPLQRLGNEHGVPLVMGGYTRMFETGHAVDYGVAYAHPIDSSHSIQFEVRDYWAFSNPSQHNVVFRIAWLVGLPD